MGRKKIIFVCFILVWTPSKAQVQPTQPNIQSGPLPNNPYTQDSQQSPETIEVKSPLIRTLVSRLTAPAEEQPNYLGGQPLNLQGTDFFSTFLQHLQTRRTQNQSFEPQADRLELTIRGASLTELNIQFLNSMFGSENFNRVIELLADSLAFVVQEAERLGFHPSFKYLVSLTEVQPMVAFGPGLSANVLKSAAG